MSDRTYNCTLLGVAALLFFSAGLIKAQRPAPAAAATYKPSELQQTRLELRNSQLQNAQLQLAWAQQNYQQASAALDAEGEAVKKEQGWADAVFNRATLAFSKPPDPPKPAAPTKAPEAAK